MSAVARPSRTTLQVVAAVLVVLGALVVVGRLSQAGLETRPPAAGPPPSRPLVTRISVGGPVEDVAVSSAGVWVLHGGRIWRVDPHTNRVVAQVAGYQPRTDRPVVGLIAGAGQVWASVAGQGVLQIDPDRNRVRARVAVATQARAALGGGDGVWVVCCQDGSRQGAGWLVRLAAETGEVVARTPLPGRPDAVGAGPSGVWVRGVAGEVWRVDPDTGRVVATIRVPGGLGARSGSVAVTSSGVWVSDPAHSTVWRIDPDDNQVDLAMVERVDADGAGLAVAADGIVWATSGTSLLGLEEGAIHYGPTLEGLGGGRITAIAAGLDALWVAAAAGLVRVDLATLP